MLICTGTGKCVLLPDALVSKEGPGNSIIPMETVQLQTIMAKSVEEYRSTLARKCEIEFGLSVSKYANMNKSREAIQVTWGPSTSLADLFGQIRAIQT